MALLPFAVIPLSLGAITSGNERAAQPASHLGEFKAPGMVWRSNGATNLWARGDMGAARTIDYASVLAANAAPATNWRLRMGGTDLAEHIWANHANMTLTDQGNGLTRLSKTGGTSAAYNAAADTETAASGDFLLTINPRTTDKMFFIGTNDDPDITTDYNDINRAIRFVDNGTIQWWENGAQIGGTMTTYTTSDWFFMRRVSGLITLWKGNSRWFDPATMTLVHTGSGSSGARYADSSFLTVGGMADVSFSALPSYDSGVRPFIDPAITREDALYHSWLEPTPGSRRYWRVDIYNHSGDFEASALVLGEKIVPTSWYSPGWSRGVEDLGDIDFSRWGVADEQPGLVWRRLQMRFGWLSEADYETKFGPLVQKLGKRGVALWCFDPASSVYRQSKTYLGWLRNSPAATHSRDTPAGIRYEKEFDILSML